MLLRVGFSSEQYQIADNILQHGGQQKITIYSTVALVPPMSTMDVWRGIT